MIHGQGIKKKLDKLESILREDLIRSMAFQLSALNDRELTEYAEVISRNAGVYAELQQSVVEAIEFETKEITRTSLR